MIKKKKIWMIAIVLLFVTAIATFFMNSKNRINAQDYVLDMLFQTDNSPSDIAQIFITTENMLTKYDYAKAKIVICDAEGGAYETLTDENAEIKIRGNSTADLDKIPYNIKLSSSQQVLGMPAGEKWCLLANFLDTSLMRNKLAYDFAKNIGLAYSCDTRYVDVWMNGKYQGNYLITVPVETGNNRVNIDTNRNEFLLELESNRVEFNTTYITTQMCRFKLDAPETLTDLQEAWLTQFLKKTENALFNSDYAELQEYIDIDSFVDFYIVQELFKNLDVHTSSTRFYIKDNKLYAGPLWDCDLSSGNVALYVNYSHYMIYNNYEKYGNSSGNSYEGFWALNGGPSQNYYSSWIGNLMRCSEFRAKLIKRYRDLQGQIVNLYKDNALGINQMDLLLNRYQNSFERNNKRWSVARDRGSRLYRDNEKTFADSVQFLRSWLESRNQWLLGALSDAEYPIDVESVEE